MQGVPKRPTINWYMKQGIQNLHVQFDKLLVAALQLKRHPPEKVVDIEISIRR